MLGFIRVQAYYNSDNTRIICEAIANKKLIKAY